MNYSLKLLVGFLAAAGMTTGINLAANPQQTPGTMTGLDGSSQQVSPTQQSPAQSLPSEQAPMQSDPTQPSSAPLPPSSQSSVSVPDGSGSLSIDAIAERSDSFNIFNSLLRVANSTGGLSSQLASGGTYTVFAPTDAAFGALPEGTIAKLVQPENRATLLKILSYHIVPGKVESSEIKPGAVKSIEGSSLNIQANAGSVTVSDAQVIRPDIEASNGVSHAVNKVILPPDVQASLEASPQASRNVNPAY